MGERERQRERDAEMAIKEVVKLRKAKDGVLHSRRG